MDGNNANERIFIQGKSPDDRWTAPSWDRVGPRYFETIGTRLLRGRVIDEHDTPAARHVAVVNETFAHRYFPNEDPIGQRFGMSDVSHSGDYEIVGIVENAKYQDTHGPAYATFFLPLLQTPAGEPVRGWVSAIELHVAGRPENIEPAVREALAGIDPNLTVLKVMSFGEQVARNFNQERLIARLAELFGILALILACVGLYGVTAYAVARRTNEIGIRMAMGAERTNILTLVMRSALGQVAWGMAIGIPVALAGGRVLADQLYGVRNYDPTIVGLGCDGSSGLRTSGSGSSRTPRVRRGSSGRFALRVDHRRLFDDSFQKSGTELQITLVLLSLSPANRNQFLDQRFVSAATCRGGDSSSDCSAGTRADGSALTAAGESAY